MFHTKIIVSTNISSDPFDLEHKYDRAAKVKLKKKSIFYLIFL